jgi:hypothetical protein
VAIPHMRGGQLEIITRGRIALPELAKGSGPQA